MRGLSGVVVAAAGLGVGVPVVLGAGLQERRGVCCSLRPELGWVDVSEPRTAEALEAGAGWGLWF